MADKDITSVRLGTKEDNREEIRKLFDQAMRVNEADAACIAASRKYTNFFKELAAHNDGYDVSTYQARIVIDSFDIDNAEKATLHTGLDEVQREKKSVFRQAARRYVELFKKSKIEEYKESITTLEKWLELEERIIMPRDHIKSKKSSTRPTVR